MQENITWVIMFCFVDQAYIWKEQVPLQQFLHLNYIKLKKYAILDATDHMDKSKQLWLRKKNYLVAKKNIVHAIRLLNYAEQLLTQGCVHDFTQGNDYWQIFIVDENAIPIYEVPTNEWEEYEVPRKRHVDMMMEELTKIRPIESSNLDITSYVREYEIDALWQNLSMHIAQIPLQQTEQNVILAVMNQDSPVDVTITRDSSTYILEKGTNRILGVTHPFIHKMTAEETLKLGDTLTVHEKIDGMLFLLMWYQGKWHFIVPSVLSIIDCKQVKNRHARRCFHRITMPPKRVITTVEEQQIEIQEHSLQISNIVEQIWNELNYELPTDTETCFSFELCLSPQAIEEFRSQDLRMGDLLANNVVIHDRKKIILHGAHVIRDNNISRIDFEQSARKYNWEHVKRLMTLQNSTTAHDQLLSIVANMNPIHQEGIVVSDEHGNMVQYVCPQFKDLIDRARYHHLSYALQQMYDRLWIECNADHRAFVARTKNMALKTSLFKMYQRKWSAREYFAFCDDKKLQYTLEAFEKHNKAKI
jgi:hypothetical protein